MATAKSPIQAFLPAAIGAPKAACAASRRRDAALMAAPPTDACPACADLFARATQGSANTHQARPAPLDAPQHMRRDT